MPRGHILYGITLKLLARGNGDDALFELLDGSGRVADVHLTWSKSQERLPWPGTDIYRNLNEWCEQVMVSEHKEWQNKTAPVSDRIRPRTDVENYLDKNGTPSLTERLGAYRGSEHNPDVNMARVHWNAGTSHLTLVFACDSLPSEDDLEWQELAMTELLAEFPEIVTCECLSPVSNSRESDGLVVYSKTK